MATDTVSNEASRLARLLSFLEHDPSNVNLLLDAMGLATELGDTAVGLRLVEHLETNATTDPRAFAYAAHLLLQAGQFAAAGVWGSRALAGGVDQPAVLFNAAFGHFYGGDYASAAEHLAKLTADEDCPVATLVMHARALHQQELTEEAEVLIRRAQQREPSNIEVRGLLAFLQYENDDNPSALQTARETLVDNPDQLDALIACASAHFELGSIEASRKTWLHTVAAHPNCGRGWSGLGQLEFNELEFVDAEKHLLLAVEFMPDHIGTWHLLAWIYILRNDSAQARNALDKSYELDRNFGETHGGLAIVDVMDNHDDRARMGIRRALKLNPVGLGARYAEMLLLQKAGQTDKAQQLVDQVIDRTLPNSHNTGRMLIDQWLKKHQQKGPDFPSGQH
jgi:tetratricopeptide (TPR) repeat protein